MKIVVRLGTTEPPNQDELQALIASHPDIVGETEGELLFIARESGFPDAGLAAARWTIDHLFGRETGSSSHNATEPSGERTNASSPVLARRRARQQKGTATNP